MPAAGMSSDSGNNDLTTHLLPPSNPTLSSSTKIEKVNIDEMLRRYSGEFGSWQLRHFVLTSLAWALEAFHTMVMIFADREPEWRCIGDGCSSLSRTVCGFEPGSWEWIGGLGASTVSEWGLVCGDKYKIGLVQSAFFAGCMVVVFLIWPLFDLHRFIQGPETDPATVKKIGNAIDTQTDVTVHLINYTKTGAGIFGHLSDSFLGRKGSLTVVCIMNAIFGCLTALSPNYWIYILLRFLTGLSTGGVGLCAFVLSTEPIGATHRGAVGMSTFYFFSGGIAMLSGIAYIFRSWRALYVAASIPSILYLLTVIPFISESPRWYLVRGKVDQAMKIMREITQGNGKHLPSGVQLALDDDRNNDKISTKEEDEQTVTGSLLDVVKLPITRVRLVLTVAINFLCSIVYYGLSLNVVNLDTNLYINVLLNAVAEMPAFTLTALLLDRFGRRPLGVGTMWFSGIFCLLGSLLNNYGNWKIVKMVCGILGIFGMAGTYNLLFIYTAELFPTVVRNAALGCATQASQMGAILAPLVVVMGGGLPFAVFGVCGIVGGFLVFYLPETLNRPLYDTMAGIEDGEKERVDV